MKVKFKGAFMDSYSNDDKNIRINRFITAEFLPAVEKYKLAKSFWKIGQ